MGDILPKFGDYVEIEMKRHGCENELYQHKVIGQESSSNSYVDVPVQEPPKETRHDEIVPIVRCVCRGLDERKIFKYRAEDVRLMSRSE